MSHAIGMANLSGGWYQVSKGDWLAALPFIELGLEGYRKGYVYTSLPHALASSSLILAHLCKAKEAEDLLTEGEHLLGKLNSTGQIDQSGMDYAWLGRAALELDHFSDAQRLAIASLKCSAFHPGYAAHAKHLLGELATVSDTVDLHQAETHYRDALALAEPRGMRPLVAHCHLGLGKLYKRTGKLERASDHLITATRMYREMDMRFYLEKAEVQVD